MKPIAPNLYRAVRGYARKIRAKHDDFRMRHFMYSLPEDIRKDLGWPDFEGGRLTRDR